MTGVLLEQSFYGPDALQSCMSLNQWCRINNNNNNNNMTIYKEP